MSGWRARRVSAACRCSYLSVSKAYGRPPELPFFFRFASWSFLTRNKSELVLLRFAELASG